METNEFLDRLRHWAEVTPERTIFKEAGKEGMNYRQFYMQVCATADALLHMFGGALPEDPVAVAVGRDVCSLAAMFGVCAAGGWYVPIDAELPSDRAAQLLSVCKPCVILLPTKKDPFAESTLPKLVMPALSELTGTANAASDLTPTSYEEIDKLAHETTLTSDAQSTGIIPKATAGHAPSQLTHTKTPKASNFPPRADTLPMFGIFTSGSTGVPKLVVKDRRGMQSFIEAYCSTFAFTSDEVFGNQIPFYFDASTKDIFATVYLGATTVIFPQQAFSFPMNLVKLLNESRISTIVWVPSALSVAARFNVFAEAVPETIKNVLFVGERMPVRYLNVWKNALPNARFVNLYGSTEVAGNSCYYIVDREFDDDAILPIGKPFPTAKVFLLDSENKPADEGEICIAGNGLALSYYGDPEKTEAAFEEISFGRIYHSGDFGRINEYGEYVCAARKDAQIKHMGHRIELGDIEACASTLDYVAEACCLYDPDAEKIVLLCAADAEHKRSLRKDLSAKLPKYMQPHEYLCLPELFHNRNGKIDRARLLKEWSSIKTVQKEGNTNGK